MYVKYGEFLFHVIPKHHWKKRLRNVYISEKIPVFPTYNYLKYQELTQGFLSVKICAHCCTCFTNNHALRSYPLRALISRAKVRRSLHSM